MLFFKKRITPFNQLFPDGFVDIHSHLLPGIDDGAKNLDDSIAMIKRLRSLGIKNITTSPHILGDLWPNTPEIINDKLKLVQEKLIAENISDVNLNATAEYMLDELFMVLLEQKQLLTLKDDYLLIEMSFMNHPENLFEIIFEIQTKGYKPILAHPERYSFYHRKFEMYQKLKELGCYFQLNLLSLTKYYGSEVYKIAVELLQNNMIDFLGTDIHNQNHINYLEKLGTTKNTNLLQPIINSNDVFIRS